MPGQCPDCKSHIDIFESTEGCGRYDCGRTARPNYPRGWKFDAPTLKCAVAQIGLLVKRVGVLEARAKGKRRGRK